MAEIIRSWLRSRLGVIIDLTPEIFGRYCRDGTFLAKLLHSYDIINDSQLQTITQTSDPALARVNLRHLRVWLRFIGVDCNDQCLEDISNGKGTASLHLFYKVFLCLENKDRLHFITLQKEREKYIPTSTKFDVKVVSEEPPFDDLPHHPLSAPLAKSASLIKWHRKKFQGTTEDCKGERGNFPSSQESKASLRIPAPDKFNALDVKEALKKNEMTELDEFSQRHKVKTPIRLEPLEIGDRTKKNQEPLQTSGDPEAAKRFMKTLKSRKRQEAATQNVKIQMQKILLAHVWEKIESDQERELDRTVARKILRQSQYEKQMVKKLCDIRSERIRIAANRQLVEELMQKTRENEVRMKEETAKEDNVRDNEEIDDEYRRMNKLHQRMTEENLRRTRSKLDRLALEAVKDVVDISVTAAEFKNANNNYIPERMWNEWRALFLKHLPIFDVAEDFYTAEEQAEEEVEEVVSSELARRDILNERDFADYQDMNAPWNEFVRVFDAHTDKYLQLGLVVMGYIVHRILQKVYSTPEPTKSRPSSTKVRVVIEGVPESLYSPLQEFLKHKKIQLVLVEDAINYCLHCYKEEMKDFEYVDLNLRTQSAENTIPAQTSKKLSQSKKRKKTEKKLKREKSTAATSDDENIIDKQTQTPKVIPYDDMHPMLSDAAYIGQWTHQFLTLGKPISDELTAKIIIEYLKSLTDAEGWVLINYPNTYRQMSNLEFALSGRKLPEYEHLNLGDISIEEIDPTASRIIFHLEDDDSCPSVRESRLLPNPLNREDASNVSSCLTGFIKMFPKPNDVNLDEEELLEFLPEDTNSVDNFFRDQGLASAVYYASCNLPTLERVARLIIGETSLSRKPSTELFGAALENSAKSVENLISLPDAKTKESEPCSPLPGEPDWTWVHLPIPPEVVEALATLWGNLEDTYIDGLKEILSLKRFNFIAVIPYKDFITRHMTEFIQRPDNKQALLQQFQKAFNDIPEDTRDDDDVKCELHCRVTEFQAELWDICHSRRREAADERKRIILDHWTSMQTMILTNIYLAILQLEMDRSVDTLQLIENYYRSMLQRSLEENKFSKVLLHKLSLNSDNPAVKDDSVSSPKSSSRTSENRISRGKSTVMKPPLPGIQESDFKNEIADFLLNLDKGPLDLTETSCFKIIQANIHYVQSMIERMLASASDTLISEKNICLTRSPADRKGKKSSLRKSSKASNQIERNNIEPQKLQHLFLEWEYAFMFELNRIRMRLTMLEATARSDIDFLLGSIQRAFVSIHELINERYEREIKSVNEMARSFCLAIEQGRPIKEELILDGDSFSIHSQVLMYPDTPRIPPSPISEKFEDVRFTISQLGRLKSIVQRVAPSGFIPERSFVYILQDLIACGDEEHSQAPLPRSWFELRPDDVIELLHELLGDVQYIDWREFLIYAMDIEMPTQVELLDAIEAFREKDHGLTKVIYRDQFILVPLWFLRYPQASSMRSSLHDDYEKDEQEMFEEEFDIKSWRTRFESTIKLKKPKKAISFRTNSAEKFNVEHRDKNQLEEVLRKTLIKELLCEMFLVSYHTVNYMAMLLSFCKDEDPRLGLGKAFSLALGKQVCTEFDKGEKYVEELLEEKRLLADVEKQQISLRENAIKVSKEVLEALINKTVELCQVRLLEGDNHSLARIDEAFRELGPILIEKLDQPGETIDPTSLLIDETEPMIDSLHDDLDTYHSMEYIGESSTFFQFDEDITESRRREMIYWLPINVCESVLSALIPVHAIQKHISNTGMSFNENLMRVYLDIKCEILNNEVNVALAHRVVNHDFIVQLLYSTEKFTSKNLANITEDILRRQKEQIC